MVISGVEVGAGERTTINMQMARLYTHARLDVPVHVIHGRRPGPRLFVTAAIHGDEINGVEIIRRLLKYKSLRRLRGTLVAVPVVNVYGFVNRSRYLPDRRDLNRAFPGSDGGSLASRVASLLMEEVVEPSSHGIDLHTGSNHRSNLPQIRARLSDPETERLAQLFRPPIILDANLRDGSLRQAGADLDMPLLLYECGEALRYDERAIRVGLRGVVSVMRGIGMLPRLKRKSQSASREAPVARASRWVRAPVSGILHTAAPLGKVVEEDELLGVVTDPLGEAETEVRSSLAGVIVGRLELPLVYQGDAVFHVAAPEGSLPPEALIDGLGQEFSPSDADNWQERS